MASYRFSRVQFFKTFSTEQKVRDWLWQTCFPSDFQCPPCKSPNFYQHTSRPEIRTCRECLKQIRLRAGTLFEHSKPPLEDLVSGPSTSRARQARDFRLRIATRLKDRLLSNGLGR